MNGNAVIDGLKRKFNRLSAELDERGRRWWAAREALELGRGRINTVAQATGMGERTIRRGCEEIRQDSPGKSPAERRTRHPGGGRKALPPIDPRLVSALEALVEPATRGDPMSPLRWTCKSTRKLAKALAGQGHKASHTKVAQLLADLGYSLQSTRKRLEGASHPDRDAQFRYINRCVKVFQRAGQPVILILVLSTAAGCEALQSTYLQSDSSPTNNDAASSGVLHSQRLKKSEILAAHNKYRQAVGVPGLIWSDTVATSAQQWADHLAATRSFKHGSSEYGENIWSGTTDSFSQTDMVDRWGNEKQYFIGGGSFPNVCRDDGRKCGHYTQMIWRNTTALGCGLATDGARDYLVCQYNPPGNYQGQRPY